MYSSPEINHTVPTHYAPSYQREQGFLQVEKDAPDPDLACLGSDISKIQQIQVNGGWGNYKIEFSQMNNASGEFHGGKYEMLVSACHHDHIHINRFYHINSHTVVCNLWDDAHRYDGRHPLTRKRVLYDMFQIIHTPSDYRLSGVFVIHNRLQL